MAHNNGKPALKGIAAQLPTTKQGVASLGLRVAVRMTADALGQTSDQILLDLSVRLDCNLSQLKHYYRHDGLPEFMVDWAVKYFNENGIRLGRHQLSPTKAVLSGYGII